ncbi:MAG TPA: MerR family transcriptional regulator [Candidatus Angelobacter sp.]|nr:MerR family transcriptional regulator [Candidatus Angelobacter sp.]
MYKVSEFAEKAGVTVRTLHHYDRLGLLRPARSKGGYRLYSDRDLARLQQITTLKFVGVPLRQIKALLDHGRLDLPQTLRLQKEILAEKRRQIDVAIQAIEVAEHSARLGQPADWQAVRKIIEVMEMQSSTEWTKKYYSQEALAKIAERARTWTPKLQAKVSQQWKELIADVEAAHAAGEDPAGSKAQALAQRWSELLKGFTGSDPEIQKGLNKLYADQGNWPAGFEKPCSDQAQAFIMKAFAAARKK